MRNQLFWGWKSIEITTNILEIAFSRAAPTFDNLFMGCVFNIITVHKTFEKLTFQAFYRSSHACK